jgi:aspartate aminotransferase
MLSKINSGVAKVKGSATFEINEKCKVLRSKGRTIYSLGLGQSPFVPPPSIVESLKRNAKRNRYSPSKGVPELRQAISGFYKRRYDLNITPDQVSVGTGAKELLFLMQLISDDPLILPSPCWSSYAPQAFANKKDVLVLHTKKENRWNLLPDELDRFCKITKFEKPGYIILNYPSNPTGQTYRTDELKELAEVCRKNKLIVISDEIYSLLTYDNNYDSIARYYPEGTIICSGLSKWAAMGGWRLGTFIFPKELDYVQKALTNIISESTSSPTTPVQWAAIDAFHENFGRGDSEFVSFSRDILGIVGNKCAEILLETDIITHKPEGGFYIFIDFEKYKDKLYKMGIDTGKKMCDRILEDTGVAILPGNEFMRDDRELSARIAFIDFDGDTVLEGVAYMNWFEDYNVDEKFVLEKCDHTIQAMRELAKWANTL